MERFSGLEDYEKKNFCYHAGAYFYRVVEKQEEKDIPMRPAALTNMPLIDEKLGNIAVNFWDLTWNDENRHLPYEMRLLPAEGTIYTEISIRKGDIMNEAIKAGEVFKLAELVPYVEGKIVNMDVVHNDRMKCKSRSPFR